MLPLTTEIQNENDNRSSVMPDLDSATQQINFESDYPTFNEIYRDTSYDINKNESLKTDNNNSNNINSRKLQLEKQLLSQIKSHIKHRFEDYDDKGNIICKFQCHTYWATQFEAVRAAYLNEDDNEHYIRSLSISSSWAAKGGKSGASFSKSMDDRFVVKVINRVEMQMFLDFAPAYFGMQYLFVYFCTYLHCLIEYMVKAFFHNLPSVLCKIMGMYTIGYHNKETGKKVLENVVVMENIFYKVSSVYVAIILLIDRLIVS